jgi:hypothetical protein
MEGDLYRNLSDGKTWLRVLEGPVARLLRRFTLNERRQPEAEEERADISQGARGER